jgi:hypothetical protein
VHGFERASHTQCQKLKKNLQNNISNKDYNAKNFDELFLHMQLIETKSQ